VYRGAVPKLTARYSGLVNGDTPASLTTTPRLSTTATSSSHPSSYPINVGGAGDGDYSISYVAGTLTVGRATPVITWAKPVPITPFTPLGSTQLNATANVPGTFTYSKVAGALLPPGTWSLSATFTPTNTTDYAPTSTTASIQVLAPGSRAVIGPRLYLVGGR